MNSNKIILVTGAEGSGKTMLAERAARSLQMKLGQIMTDSPNKSGAKNARVNLTSEDFAKQNCAITYIDSNGYHCGITEEELDNGDVFAVDFNALEAFRQQYHGEREIVTIGIASSADVCRARMLKSKEEKNIEQAIAQGKEINAQLSEVCDRVVLNDGSFGGAKARLEQIILMNLYEDSPITKYFAYNTYASEWFFNHGITLRFIFGLIGNLIEDIYGEDTGMRLRSFSGIMSRCRALATRP